MKTIIAFLATLLLAAGATAAKARTEAPVVEVVTLKIRSGVSVDQFSAIDRKLQTEYVSKRNGFLSRESAPGDDNSWVVIVHWKTRADADASMQSFETAASAATFMSMIEPGTMNMARYGR